MQELMKKYRARLVKEGIIKAALYAAVAAFASLALCTVIFWFTGFDKIWIGAIVFAVVLLAVAPVVFFAFFRPTEKAVAKRIDKDLGLDERMVTMLELRGRNEVIACAQRANAVSVLRAAGNSGVKKIAITVGSVALFVGIGVSVFLGAGMTTVSALSATGVIPSGKDLLSGAGAAKEVYTITYLVEGVGKIGGDVSQITEKDEETGEQLPFIQIFLSHYGMKKPQIRINKLKEANYLVEIKQKSEYINLFLQQQAKKWGNKKLPKDFKVWKYEQCVEFLKSLNADEEEISRAINKLADLFTDKYMKRILPVDEEDNDSKVESVNDMVNTEDNVKSEVIDKMTSMLDTALSEVETSLEMYARYYITMKIVLKYKISGFYNQMIDDYVDKGLEKFYYEKYSQYIDEKYIKDIVADYVGKRPDTVRKKLDKVKKIIQNSMLKNMARR